MKCQALLSGKKLKNKWHSLGICFLSFAAHKVQGIVVCNFYTKMDLIKKILWVFCCFFFFSKLFFL